MQPNTYYHHNHLWILWFFDVLLQSAPELTVEVCGGGLGG